MNTIVCNLKNGAVTEYTWPQWQSITPTHAGASSGLAELGGNTDDGEPIEWSISLPRQHRGTTRKKLGRCAYVSSQGAADMAFAVRMPDNVWWYPMQRRADDIARCELGRGLRPNHIGFALRGTSDEDVTIDRIEVDEVASKNRRV